MRCRGAPLPPVATSCQSPGGSCRWIQAPRPSCAHRPPTLHPQRTFLTRKPLGGGGARSAWRLKVDQKRHKVKRQRSNKRPEPPPGGNEVCTHAGTQAGGERGLHNSGLASPGARRGGAVCGGRGQVCTRGEGRARVRGRCSQTPPPSPSSRSPSVAAHAPGGSGGAAARALRGWRGCRSGRDLQGGRERQLRAADGEVGAGARGWRRQPAAGPSCGWAALLPLQEHA